MKKYFGEGYYCANKEELETIRKDRNREIFEILKDSYSYGLNAHQLEEKTSGTEKAFMKYRGISKRFKRIS